MTPPNHITTHIVVETVAHPHHELQLLIPIGMTEEEVISGLLGLTEDDDFRDIMSAVIATS